MEQSYCICYEDFRRYCEENYDYLRSIRGGRVCKDCARYKECVIKSKDSYIEGIIRMEMDDTKHKNLLKFISKHESMLYSVPAKVYEHAYGLFSSHLPCQFNTSIILENLDKIETVYSLLLDDESRLTYLNVLMYRLSLRKDYIIRAYSPIPQYHIAKYRNLTKDEVYVDCGAYIGDSFETYCKYNCSPKKAILFEPDNANVDVLKTTMQKYPETESLIVSKGCYDKSGILYLRYGEKMNSSLSKEETEGSIPIEVVAIDDVIDDEITFLKMDIEGSEKETIIGAKEHILQGYPKLAICIYHEISDLWNIPLLIKKCFQVIRNMNYTIIRQLLQRRYCMYTCDLH